MEYQISLLLFVLSVVSTSGGQQGTPCQVFPSNYTFNTSHIANANLGYETLDVCTNDPPFTTCPHPSVLTDSITGGDAWCTLPYLFWDQNNQFSQLLFTFSTEVDLEFVQLYYYFFPWNSEAPLIALEFLTVPDDFTLGTTTPPNSTSLHNVTLPRTSGTLNISIPLSTMTRMLLVNKRGGIDVIFDISEVEFYSVCETTTKTVTHCTCPETTATDPLNSSHTDTPSSTLTTDAGVENKATSIDSLTIVGYIIASVGMVWMMVLTGVVLVNLYYIMYFYK